MIVNHISVSTLPVLYRFGGAIERRIMETANEQANRGHEVHVYSVGDQTETKSVEGVTYHFIKCRSKLPFKHIEFQYKIAQAIKRGPQGGVLHFHSQPEGAIMSTFLKAKKVLQYDFYYFRGGPKTPLYPVYKRLLRYFDLLLPCSEFCLQESKAFWKLPTEKLKVLHNGVNLSQFRPDPEAGKRERETLGIDKKVVLYVGRVNEQKGSDILLEAIAKLRERRQDCQLVIAGPIGQFGMKTDPDRWQDRIEKVGGLYLGAVAENRLASIYNLADVFVMPTRIYEMFGMAAVEAQACGKPVIASDCGGLREVVPNECGARFPVGDSTQLANEIEKLVDDPNRYATCSKNALANAAQYDWKNICDALDRLYTS
jgi:glycosyltransferase involved in cell wall biosynthesis